MPQIHRDGDPRNCGATTIVTGQSSVYIGGKLIAVEGDQCTHGGGDLVSQVGSTIKINGKKIIVVGDTALPDLALHNPPATAPAASAVTVEAY